MAWRKITKIVASMLAMQRVLIKHFDHTSKIEFFPRTENVHRIDESLEDSLIKAISQSLDCEKIIVWLCLYCSSQL